MNIVQTLVVLFCFTVARKMWWESSWLALRVYHLVISFPTIGKENRNLFLQLSNFQGFNWMLIKSVVFNRSSSNVGTNSIFWRPCIYRFWKWTQKTRLKKMGQTLTLTLKGRVNVLCWKHQLVRWAILCSALVSD
jgi:hypothetical protein